MPTNEAAVINYLVTLLGEHRLILSAPGCKALLKCNYDYEWRPDSKPADIRALTELHLSLEDALQAKIEASRSSVKLMSLPYDTFIAADRLNAISNARATMRALLDDEMVSMDAGKKTPQLVGLQTIDKALPLAFDKRELELANRIKQSFAERAAYYTIMHAEHGVALGDEGKNVLGDLKHVAERIAGLAKDHALQMKNTQTDIRLG